jgi:hypothetical protein
MATQKQFAGAGNHSMAHLTFVLHIRSIMFLLALHQDLEAGLTANGILACIASFDLSFCRRSEQHHLQVDNTVFGLQWAACTSC